MVPTYLCREMALEVANGVARRTGAKTSTLYIGGAESMQRFVRSIPPEFVVAVIDGESEVEDQVDLSPHDLLAFLPASPEASKGGSVPSAAENVDDHYPVPYEPSKTGAEKFNPGDITITPGAYGALALGTADVDKTVQSLLRWHLTGLHGSVSGKDLVMNKRQIETEEEPHVRSAYPMNSLGGEPLWIITEHGHTTILLPEEE